MRILHVINTLKTGGAEKLISEIVPLMIKEGLEVEVAVFIGGDTPLLSSLINNGVIVHVFKKSGSVYNPIHIFKLRKLIYKFDIIHTHNTSPQIFGAIASYKHKSKKFITTEHSTNNRRRGNFLLKVLDLWMYHKYDKIICISEQVRCLLKNHIPKLKQKLITINNGIDISKFHNATPIDITPKNKFIICMVAGFRYQKDHETAIKAMSILNPQKYELWLVGDGERRNAIENLITILGCKENIQLLGIRNDIESILKTADVVLQSSHIEGFGLAAVEGMAAGCPVIATNVPGLAQVVDGAGILVPPKDYKELAKTIEALANNQVLYKEVAKKCFDRAQHFTLETMVNNYIKIYISLINKESGNQ